MDYFVMQQDYRLSNLPKPVTGSLNLRRMTHEQIGDNSQLIILVMDESRHNEYPDYLEDIGMLVRENVLDVLTMYQKDLAYRMVILTELKKHRQETYYLVSVPQIQCLTSESTRDLQHPPRRFILDKEKVATAKVFCDDHYGKQLIVHLDVAERILRRDSYGVWFERIHGFKE